MAQEVVHLADFVQVMACAMRGCFFPLTFLFLGISSTFSPTHHGMPWNTSLGRCRGERFSAPKNDLGRGRPGAFLA